MRMLKSGCFCSCVLAVALTALFARADTHTAASASYADVSAAVTAASSGDTVVVPSGSATWNSCLAITKGIILKGAGIGNTVLTSNITNQYGGIISYSPANPALNEPFRITGFTMNCNQKSNGIFLQTGGTPITQIRVDHNAVSNAGGANAGRNVYVNGSIYGVIDNNTLSGTGKPVGVHGADDASWVNPRDFGNSSNMYVEDNTITTPDNVMDDGQGGRYACRYNSISGFTANVFPIFDMHGNQPGGIYGTMMGELYGNNLNLGTYQGTMLDHRGGQALVFFNKLASGSSIYSKTRDEYDDNLSGDGYLQKPTNTYHWNNRYNGTLFGASVLIEQTGVATGGGSNYLSGSGLSTTYGRGVYGIKITSGAGAGQCRNITAATTTQYTVSPNWTTIPDSTSHYSINDIWNYDGVQENREFYNHQTSFNGTVGMGCGPLSSRPTTCTVGVAYWATDQDCTQVSTANCGTHPTAPISGTLYICTATNTWTAYYTPYTYPHPLRYSGSTGDPDTTAPSAPPAVRDGTGADISTTNSTTQLSANWDAGTDAQSGISGYQYAIGTTAGGTQTVNWTSLGNVLTVTKTGLSLTGGQTYYFSVKAVNGAGLTGNATNSNGQTVVDTTPPSAPPAVRDGTGADIAYTSSTTQLSANWDASTDAESGISGYQYAVGTTAGGTQTVNWTSLGNVTTITKTGLSLTNGQTYFFSVKAVNGAGLTGSATNSNGQKVDTTAPSAPPAVRDGTGTDISTTNSATQLSANWDASTDAESGISGYQYAIGTTAGGTQTVNWTSLGNVTTVTKTGLSLTVGQTYYFSVKAVNGAALTGTATNSNGQTVVDSTPPSAPPAVRDGTGTDISTTSSTTQLSANWDASTDVESGISGYQYAIGTTAGGTQTVNWTSLANVTTVTQTGLSLSVGQTYYFSVQAVNGAGLTGSATNSNGQTVVSGSSVIYFQDNFESWTVHGGAWSSVSGESSMHVLNTSTDYTKAGAKSLKITDTDTSGTYGACLVKNFSPAISADIYVRLYAFLPTGYETANADIRVLRVWCGSNRGQMSLMNGRPVMEEVGAWTGTSGTAVSENQWHCIEMHMAAPSASTLMEFWVDGVENSTTLSGSFSGSTTYDRIEFGDVIAAASDTGTIYLDELVVSNSYIGTGITSPVTYFQDNFENWTVHGGAWSSVTGESATHTLNTSTDYARSGTKSLKLTDTDTTASYGAYLVKNFSPAVSGDIYVRFYVFFPTGFGTTNSGCRRRILRAWCGDNRVQMSFQEGAPVMEEVGAWHGATGSAVSEGAWHCIETHGTAPSTTTLLEFWVDGVLNGTALIANFSGSTTWDYMELGDIVLGGGANGTGTFYMDEAVVSNSYVGTLP